MSTNNDSLGSLGESLLLSMEEVAGCCWGDGGCGRGDGERVIGGGNQHYMMNMCINTSINILNQHSVMNICINTSFNTLNQHPMMNICINKSINILNQHSVMNICINTSFNILNQRPMMNI